MRRPLTLLAATIVFAVGAIAGGCAFDWGFPNNGDSPDGAAETSKDSSNVPDTFKEASIVDASPPPPVACTGKDFKECGAGFYCHFADHACGKSSDGKCMPVVTGCGVGAPTWICGCDEKAYKDPCSASVAGVDPGAFAACPAQSALFRCGTRFCEAKNTFCLEQVASVVEYDCVAFDVGCGPPGDCSCPNVTKLACGGCGGPSGEVTVKCP